jgi:hypothetical protein
MRQVKIIVTNQKGGVGKSTIAANLAGYFSTQHQKKISFIDLDRQASGANLINKFHDQNIWAHKKGLLYKQSASWSLMEARESLRAHSSGADIIIVDLTWTFGLPYDFLLDFDLIITPSSDSTLEVASSEIFILEYIQKNIDKLRLGQQSIIVVPSRIDPSHGDAPKFGGLDFWASCSIAPPIYRIPNINSYYEEGFLCCSSDPVIAENFLDFGKFVYEKIQDMNNLIVPTKSIPQKSTTTYRADVIVKKIPTEPLKFSEATKDKEILKDKEAFSFIPYFLRRWK